MQELRITAKGRDLLNKIVESKLTFSNMGLGKGVVEGWDNTILELVSQVMVKPITDVIVDENRQISFKAEFTNELLEEGFNINEIGVFARDPDLGEILFAYTNSYGEEVDYFAPGTGNKIVKEIIDITMAFNDATEVELVIDPNKNYATKKDIENLEYPEFDDSGTSEGISSFTDFMNSIKSKMNICQFFRNFKSGLKFIVHTGMIVDNYATKEKGFLPDATLVTALKEQLDEQNNNLNGFYYNNTDVFEWANSIHKTRSASFSSSCTGLPTNSTFNVLRIEQGGNLATMLAIQEGTGKIFSSTYNTSIWCEWKEILTKDTLAFKNLTTDIFRKSEDNCISNADTAPFGVSIIAPNMANNPFDFWSTLITTGQDLYTQQLALPWSYADKNLKYRVKDSGTWSEWKNINGSKHQREFIKSGTIYGFISDKIAKGYTGGEIEIVGTIYVPPDSYNRQEWGVIDWIKSSSNIASICFYPDRSSSRVYRSIVPSENYDSGWVIK